MLEGSSLAADHNPKRRSDHRQTPRHKQLLRADAARAARLQRQVGEDPLLPTARVRRLLLEVRRDAGLRDVVDDDVLAGPLRRDDASPGCYAKIRTERLQAQHTRRSSAHFPALQRRPRTAQALLMRRGGPTLTALPLGPSRAVDKRRTRNQGARRARASARFGAFARAPV